MAGKQRVVGTEERLRELGDDAGAAEVWEGIGRGPGGDDRALRQRLPGPMMVGHDHVDAEPAGLLDLLRTAVMPQSTVRMSLTSSPARRSTAAAETP